MAELRIRIMPGACNIARKGKDISKNYKDEDNLFRNGAIQGVPYFVRSVVFGKNDTKKSLKLPASFVGYPLVFVQRLGNGSVSNAGYGEMPSSKWVAFHKPGSNKVTIQKQKKGKDTFMVAVMDAQIG